MSCTAILREDDQLSPAERRTGIWLALTQVVLAYEWLISGINKLLAPHFDADLVRVLRQTGGMYGWYASLLRQAVLPNHAIFAWLTPLGETAIGVVLLLGAALTVLLPRARLTALSRLAVSGALLGSIFLSLNYFFQSDTAVPWLNPNNALTNAVDITIVVALLSVVLLAANLQPRWKQIDVREEARPPIRSVTPLRIREMVPVVNEVVERPPTLERVESETWWQG